VLLSIKSLLESPAVRKLRIQAEAVCPRTLKLALIASFQRYLGVVSCVTGRIGLAPAWPGKSVAAFERLPTAWFFERNSIAVVMIRLARVGARKQPYYRIVVIEKDRARNGRSIEVVGTYNPRTNPASVELKHERIGYWRSVGAQLSPTVAKLLEKNPAPVAA
jgi:small subunit ribosomal protein S16